MEEDLKILESKIIQLKLAYERYFLGTRPREPVVERSDIERTVAIYTNTAIQNTALRFRFSSLCSRYQALKRQWNETQRKIEHGTYARHKFKADLHTRSAEERTRPPSGAPADSPDLYKAYVEARQSCGQSVGNLSPAKLEATLSKQKAALRERFGGAEIRFRVVVENGKAKLKASRVG